MCEKDIKLLSGMDYIRMGIEVPQEVVETAQKRHLATASKASVLEDKEESPPQKNPQYIKGIRIY